jgi:hypothetical protein
MYPTKHNGVFIAWHNKNFTYQFTMIRETKIIHSVVELLQIMLTFYTNKCSKFDQLYYLLQIW